MISEETAFGTASVAYRKLGNTGFDVSTIGFGMWQLGGGRWKSASTDNSVALLHAALDRGVNVYDAAVVYGQYRDERNYLQSRAQELLGAAFADRRERVYYCVKLGQFDELAHRSLYDPGRIAAQFQQSLRRLRTDYVDICLIHAPSLHDVKQGTALAVLKTLQALGLVRAVGYSFENEPAHVFAALEQRVDAIMLQYNLLDRDCAAALSAAEERGVGILVGGPFKRGYLTGEFLSVEDLPREDHYWEWNVAKNAGKVQAILDRVRPLLERYGSPPELRRAALEFVLAQPVVGSAVIGHRSLREVDENVAAVAAR